MSCERIIFLNPGCVQLCAYHIIYTNVIILSGNDNNNIIILFRVWISALRRRCPVTESRISIKSLPTESKYDTRVFFLGTENWKNYDLRMCCVCMSVNSSLLYLLMCVGWPRPPPDKSRNVAANNHPMIVSRVEWRLVGRLHLVCGCRFYYYSSRLTRRAL